MFILRANQATIEQDISCPYLKKLRSRVSFFFRYELEQISCGPFTDLLVQQGYGDRGAFAFVSEEILSGPGFWINKKAVVRILGNLDRKTALLL